MVLLHGLTMAYNCSNIYPTLTSDFCLFFLPTSTLHKFKCVFWITTSLQTCISCGYLTATTSKINFIQIPFVWVMGELPSAIHATHLMWYGDWKTPHTQFSLLNDSCRYNPRNPPQTTVEDRKKIEERAGALGLNAVFHGCELSIKFFAFLQFLHNWQRHIGQDVLSIS